MLWSVADRYGYMGVPTGWRRHQQESSSATTANTNGRKRMAQEDRRTARNAGAQICTGQRMIAAMPEAAEADADAKMVLG